MPKLQEKKSFFDKAIVPLREVHRICADAQDTVTASAGKLVREEVAKLVHVQRNILAGRHGKLLAFAILQIR